MSSINNVGNVGSNSPVQKIVTPGASKPAIATSAARPGRGPDRLELSGVSHLLKTLKTNDVRADKVASIKSQIQNGTYEDDHKLDVATNRLLDDLLK